MLKCYYIFYRTNIAAAILPWHYAAAYAGVAESADARDLKSREVNASYRFDPGHRHQKRT